jgi:pimeloyl-ACP methyl ester carboxylesterase
MILPPEGVSVDGRSATPMFVGLPVGLWTTRQTYRTIDAMQTQNGNRVEIFRSPEARQTYLERFYEPALARWPVSYEPSFVDTAYGRTHLLQCGQQSGPPVVLTNGIGEDSTYWGDTELLIELSKRFRVLLPDRVGDPGRSQAHRPIGSAQGYSQWMNDLLDGLRVRRAHLIGIHQGGWEVLCHGIRLPERVNRIICVNPGGGILQMRFLEVIRMFTANTERSLRRLAVAGSPPGYQWDEDYLSRMIDRLIYVKRECKPMVVMPRRFRNEELVRVAAPTLILIGEHNRWYNHRRLYQRAQLIPSACVQTLPGAGQNIFVEKPEESAELVCDFLEPAG